MLNVIRPAPCLPIDDRAKVVHLVQVAFWTRGIWRATWRRGDRVLFSYQLPSTASLTDLIALKSGRPAPFSCS